MRKFWKHEHKPWREHTTSCASPVTGAAITPVAYPRPDPSHNLWCVDPESCCPGCSGQRWENIGTDFMNRWLCLDCGWTTSGWPTNANVERPRRPT